jgi:hypothetical protein
MKPITSENGQTPALLRASVISEQWSDDMASICKEFSLPASAAVLWDALRDFGALHKRLVPGFVTDAVLEGDVRVVTFANGSVAREHLVTIDDDERRLVYGIHSERLRHYSAAAQVFAEGNGSRFVWIVDVLPDEMAAYISSQMELGVAAMKKAFAG